MGTETGNNGPERSADLGEKTGTGLSTTTYPEYANAKPTESRLTRLGISPDSFKRRVLAGQENQLNQTVKMRHLNMIAIGGSIGAGFFVGSGGALSTGGPASVVIDFSIIGIMMFNVVFALGELATMYPVSGGFYTYSSRFIDPSWGFAMGWNYVFQWAIVLPFEITVAALTVQYWGTGVSVASLVTIFFLIILFINIFGVLGYAEEEFWASLLKLIAVVIFMIIAFVLVLGGAPKNTGACGPKDEDGKYTHTGCYMEYWGARYWYNPGAFVNGFKGWCSVFVTAAFAFSGTELVGLAAAESENPGKHLPSAIKQVFWRITLFYILGLFFIGLLVPSDDKRLLGNGSILDVHASPFVIVAANAGLKGFDSFLNVIILISVISIGMSGVYGGSRTLCALAEQGYAPGIFKYVDRAGRPLPATIVVIAFGLLAYINVAAAGAEVFNWLLSLSGLAALFTWGSICLAHIRFRQAWKYRGHSLDEIPFKAMGGVAGSWLGIFIIVVVLIVQFYVAAFPIDAPSDPMKRAKIFFQTYLAFPVVIFFWICGYFWKGAGWLRLDQIDVDSGRREIDWNALNEERERVAAKGPVGRLMHALF